MPGEPMVIGPFIRGLNNISTAGEAEDTEVVDLVNMEVSLDKSLESRPPITVDAASITDLTETHRHKVFGTYVISETEWYLIVLCPTAGNGQIRALLRGDYNDYVIVHSISLTLYTEVPADMVQFKDSLYFIMPPGSTKNGFSWSKTGTYTEIPTMPKALSLVSWKNRLWAGGSPASTTDGDRIWFSSVDKDGLHPDKWEAVNFFDTAPGEGGFITGMIPFFNNMIIFKNDGTWRFSYSADPAGGLVEKISGTVGAANKDCIVEFEGLIYCYDQGTIYELVNSSFTPINIKLKFKPDNESDFAETEYVTLSVINRRLAVRYRNAMYIYSAETRTWTQWRSSRGLPYKFFELPKDSGLASSSTYVAAQNSPTYRTRSVDLSNIPIIMDGNHVGLITGHGNTATISGLTGEARAKLTGDEQYSCSPGQPLEVSLNVDMTSVTTANIRVRFFLIDGAVTLTPIESLSQGANSFTFNTPNNAVYFEVLLTAVPVDDSNSLTVSGLNLARLSGPVPSYLMKMTYEYAADPIPQEIIECNVMTKIYDFGVPSVFKRLFLWGLDVKTVSRIVATTLLTRQTRLLSFGDLDGQLHSDLATGTWFQPMYMQTDNNRIVDVTDPIAEQTGNNRFFVKLIKGLRFRQIAFNIRMITDGTLNTGPVKLYTITAYVASKQMVVDKIS